MTVQQAGPHLDIEVRHATPDDADGIAALYDRAYDGGYSITECTDPALVRRVLADRQHIWVLAVDGARVIGAIVARHDPANASYELCRAAVDPGYRGRANYSAVFGLSFRDAVDRPDCEMIYGYARSEYARRMFSRARLRWSWTGTDGGMHLVAAEREEHLFGMAFNPERLVTRVVPPLSILIPESAVAREITILNSMTRTGDYPSRIAAGGAVGLAHESDCGRVSYSLFELSRAAVVSAVEGDTPDDVRRVLWEVIEGAAPSKIEHMTIHALADKLSVIAELCRPDPADPIRRFTVRGYLPGWHKDGEARYDCVTLTTCSGGQIPHRLGLEARMESIYRSFPSEFR